jgi:2-polyprenyl-3-methyl-5-hydroxy-6-metoxy-1,4-benzoquinol methylase
MTYNRLYWLQVLLPQKSIPPPPTPSRQNPDAFSSEARAQAKVNLSHRADLIEMMDQPCSYEELRGCLHDIARVNRLTFAYRPTISWMEELVAARPSTSAPLTVVDVGCGDGNMLRRVHAWAARRGVPVALTGIDLNPDAIRAATESTPPALQINWIVGDALSSAATGDIDVVICSLLTHHLTNPQIVQFLQWAERATRRGWFINDLHRKAVPYHLFRLWARFTNWHPFVKNDGAVSIRRSFIVDDWQRLCAAAGLDARIVSIKEYRPARLCVGRIK